VTTTSRVSGGLALPAASVATQTTAVVPRGKGVVPSGVTFTLSMRVVHSTVAPATLSTAVIAGHLAGPTAPLVSPTAVVAYSGVPPATSTSGRTVSAGGDDQVRKRIPWCVAKDRKGGDWHISRPEVQYNMAETTELHTFATPAALPELQCVVCGALHLDSKRGGKAQVAGGVCRRAFHGRGAHREARAAAGVGTGVDGLRGRAGAHQSRALAAPSGEVAGPGCINIVGGGDAGEVHRGVGGVRGRSALPRPARVRDRDSRRTGIVAGRPVGGEAVLAVAERGAVDVGADRVVRTELPLRLALVDV
jgi:hypothetical protein